MKTLPQPRINAGATCTAPRSGPGQMKARIPEEHEAVDHILVERVRLQGVDLGLEDDFPKSCVLVIKRCALRKEPVFRRQAFGDQSDRGDTSSKGDEPTSVTKLPMELDRPAGQRPSAVRRIDGNGPVLFWPEVLARTKKDPRGDQSRRGCGIRAGSPNSTNPSATSPASKELATPFACRIASPRVKPSLKTLG